MRVLINLPVTQVRRRCGRWRYLAAAALAWGSTPAMADQELTLLTIDGRELQVAEVAQPSLRRIESSEGGFNVAVDDYAVLRRSGRRLRLSFSTEAFRIDDDQLAAARRLLDADSSDSGGVYSNASDASRSDGKAAPAESALLIRHPYVHPAGHNYTPTPRAEFLPQVMPDGFEGRNGFAVIAIGESGRVRQVKLLDQTGQVRLHPVQAAISKGISSQFEDEQRHDHTVYMAYEVRNQELRQVGEFLVTLPMCCGGCVGICP